MSETTPEQITIPCVLMRGGTSKALFFHEADVPPPGAGRDRALMRAMGTPDVLQIDGLGGSRLVTSKIAIVQRSSHPDADVDYTFMQVDVERPGIFSEGNCGNISAAVGPFAIDEGLVEAVEPLTTVRIYNTNSDKILVARVPVRNGKARVAGDCAIPGVPGTGAKILMDYSATAGAMTGKLLPTGNVVDTIALEDGRKLDVSLVDMANPCVFVSAADLGQSGDELAPAISANGELIATMGEIQAKCGQLLGLWPDWKEQHLPGLPLLVMVSPPADYIDMNGDRHAAAGMDMRARLVFLGKCHETMAGTGSICTTAASRIAGSVAHRAVGAAAGSTVLRIGHSLGVMEVDVVTNGAADPEQLQFAELGFARTARRLMDGQLYLPREFI
ncbi:MAG: PrpF domain-containing protein [Pseudomonadota bacterium]